MIPLSDKYKCQIGTLKHLEIFKMAAKNVGKFKNSHNLPNIHPIGTIERAFINYFTKGKAYNICFTNCPSNHPEIVQNNIL